MIVYLVDKVINIINKNKVISSEFKSLNKGMIDDKDLFIIEFKELMKVNKIRGKLLNDNIKIINTYYNKRDQFYLEAIFTELGFFKVIFEDIKGIFLNNDYSYIEINNTYLVIYLDNRIGIDIKYFNDALEVINIFKDKLKDNIILFGVNEIIPKIKIKNKNIYYLDNYEDYIIKKFIK